ncbi:MAG: hypothetical protein ACPGO3_09935 [Magnetospiraceae bacterium]
MDLYAQFETAPEAETEGVWVDIGGGAEIRVARAGNPAHRAAADRLTKPYRAVLRAGGNLPDKTQREIAIESMVEAILLDWRGVTGPDGGPLPYSKENARRALSDLKDFRDLVTQIATAAETFRKSALEQAAKNFEAPSAGPSSLAARPSPSF